MVRPRTLRMAAFFLLGFLARGASVDAAESRDGREPAKGTVDFDRQIRPILSNNCFQCHGPDAEVRQADLRLDVRDDALAPAESGKPAIVPGKPAESPLVARVFSSKRGFKMPPPESNKVLSATEKSLLRQWVEQGANYERHWSFVVPRRPREPVVKRSGWARNAIDRFVLARLETEGLRPSPEADKTTLLRRLSLDLTGLPPTPREVDAFLDDRRGDAYEAVVDRLLASPHFGERLAVDWLDAARFADTHGYHIDSGRDMTRWRDWVIDAFSRNMRFDRFTIEQLAGDLLPGATVAQQVASGFNRNHMINFEGGAIPEEYQTAYVIDRVNTTGTVWLGLTIACTQCHDHKFDPLTQKDFYRFYAFFNNLPENGLDGTTGNAEPKIKVPTDQQRQRLERVQAAIAAVERQLNSPRSEIDALQAKWESAGREPQEVRWVDLDPSELRSKGGATLTKTADKAIVASGVNPTSETYTIVADVELPRISAIRLEALPDDRLAGKGPGRSVNGNIVLTEVRFEAGHPLRIKAASADFSQDGFPIAQAIDGQPSTGWGLSPQLGMRHAAIFELAEPLQGGSRTRLTATLGFQSAYDRHQLGRFRLSATLSPRPLGLERPPAQIAAILATGPAHRSASQQSELRAYFRTQVCDELKPLGDQLARLRKEAADLDGQIPTTMVMRESPQPRETFMLLRGQYDKRGDKVGPGVPACLPSLPAGVPVNRLGLARWLVDQEQPLTSRVIVNRYWQMIFGTGLVKTAEDFGAQGELPSHPELLDWLAVEFREGWDIKALIRLMVTSATYRQASVVTPESVAKDPENRLLARGPRLRLPAEFIRDQALAVSGLLDGRIGGSSVSPYQPAGLWEELASRLDGKNWTAQSYEQSHGRDLYRRTMYTFWKRTSPPPTLVTFDAPDRETCTVRRSRTNTPLQALVLLNDPTYVEASRKLAERMMTQAGPSAEARIAFAFRLATARRPTAEEAGILKELFDTQLATYRRDLPAALKLLGFGESARDRTLDAAELAAWSMVAATILNLDETITKG